MTEAISTPNRRGRWTRAIVVACAAAASVATSKRAPAPNNPDARNYPRWQITGEADRSLACANVHAWISKSGKEGFGVSLKVESRADCTIEITRAELALRGSGVAAPAIAVEPLPAALELPGRSRQYGYVPFAFDNNGAWNRGLRDGAITLELRVNGEPAPPWTMTATHRLDGYHAPTQPAKVIAGPEGAR